MRDWNRLNAFGYPFLQLGKIDGKSAMRQQKAEQILRKWRLMTGGNDIAADQTSHYFQCSNL